MTAYKWGDDTRDTRDSIRQSVHDFITNELENGPGWVITTNRGDAYDIQVTVNLFKKPRKTRA